MAVFKRGRIWWYKFTWNGEAIRESTKHTNKRVAEQIEAAHKTSLAKGEVGIREKKAAPILSGFATAEFLPFVRSTFKNKPKTQKHYEYGVKSLLAFGKLSGRPMDAITTDVIGEFVAKRRADGLEISASTGNSKHYAACSIWLWSGDASKKRRQRSSWFRENGTGNGCSPPLKSRFTWRLRNPRRCSGIRTRSCCTMLRQFFWTADCVRRNAFVCSRKTCETAYWKSSTEKLITLAAHSNDGTGQGNPGYAAVKGSRESMGVSRSYEERAHRTLQP